MATTNPTAGLNPYAAITSPAQVSPGQFPALGGYGFNWGGGPGAMPTVGGLTGGAVPFLNNALGSLGPANGQTFGAPDLSGLTGMQTAGPTQFAPPPMGRSRMAFQAGGGMAPQMRPAYARHMGQPMPGGQDMRATFNPFLRGGRGAL